MPVNTNTWNRIRYTAFAPFYDVIATFSAQRRRSIELLNVQPGERVMISGAGTGSDLRFLHRDAIVTAIDITPAMVDRTKRRAAGLRLAVDARVGDAQALEFADGSFDAVILHLIVAVAPDGARVVQEAGRVLRANGRMVIFDKFVAEGARPTVFRRVLNVVTNAVFSDVTRQLLPMLAGMPLRVVRREKALAGLFQIVLLEKQTS